ncbi:MAG TPA: hypothetical protein VNO30_21105 [Kofleriaceae bacterium]|nr:hypothetical protein [Kofleriaceae bacterium]
MAKKTNKKPHRPKYRNAAPPPPPRAPRAPRAPRQPQDEDTPLQRLGYTAAGAAGTALIGSFLATQGWAPKTIAGALSAVGAGLAWRGDDAMIRSIGAGTMSAAGSQLALMVIDDRDKKQSEQKVATAKPRQGGVEELPPGALEAALERARMRLALASSELPDVYA